MKELKNIRSQKAFKTPEHYFSSFEDRMMNRLLSQEVEEERAFNWVERILYQLQLRFTIPTVLVCGIALIIISISLDKEMNELTYTDNEIASYLIENFDDEFERELYSNLTLEEKSSVPFTDTEILEYLYENDIDLEIIEEQIP